MPRDPEAIPSGRTRRAAKTGAALGPSALRFFGSLAANLTRSPEQAAEILERRTEEMADHAVEILGELRGGAMKVGQLASFVDVDFLPAQYRSIYQEKLADLRDSAPPMSFAKVRRVLEEEWEEPIAALFESFDETAVAAASIGQVHRAVLRAPGDGRDRDDGRQEPAGRVVAVKVQYPEIADALESDVETAAILIRLAKALAPGLDPEVVAGELRERVLEELDYELEAQNQRMFARFYREHPFIHVPAPITALSRRRVLVSEWAEGRRFADMLALPQAERDRLGEIIFRFYFGSMRHLRAFNTDSHPGNYLLRDDGGVEFIDFGSVKHVDPAYMEFRIDAVTAARDGDAERLRAAVFDLGALRERDAIDADELLEGVLAGGGWLIEDREFAIDPDYVASVIAAVSDPHALARTLTLVRKVKVPADELMLARVETGVLAVLGQLRATGNWHRMAREYWFGEEPSTELGRAEREFLGRRGVAPR